MNDIVFLNAAKLDFDRKLDFSPLEAAGRFTRYESSTDAEILQRVQGQTVVITKELPVGKDLIARFPASVRLICEAGTGYNNIDLEAARAKDIRVCNVPTYSTEAVAQMAITFVLDFSSSLQQQQRMLDKGNFANFTQHLQVPHFELQGKTLGVLGGGAIGRAVIKLARCLGMKVLVHDIRPWLVTEDEIGFVTFDELLAKSDFLTVHCPLNASTRHLLDARAFAKMKRSAYLINTARGPIIDEPALIEALEAGRIAGAALDVQENEPLSPESPLFKMENVIVTPHIGWRRLESRQRLVTLTAENIRAFFDRKLANVVNG